MVRPMVHSQKHYVQNSIETVTASTVTSITYIQAQPVGSINQTFEIIEGATVKAVFVELWVRAGDTAAGSGQLIVYKTSGDQGAPTAADMAALGDWDNKKNILYTTQGLYNDQDSNAIAAIRQWIKIPKSKQRFGLNDKLRMTISAAGAIDLHICGFALYKEYT